MHFYITVKKKLAKESCFSANVATFGMHSCGNLASYSPAAKLDSDGVLCACKASALTVSVLITRSPIV